MQSGRVNVTRCVTCRNTGDKTHSVFNPAAAFLHDFHLHHLHVQVLCIRKTPNSYSYFFFNTACHIRYSQLSVGLAADILSSLCGSCRGWHSCTVRERPRMTRWWNAVYDMCGWCSQWFSLDERAPACQNGWNLSDVKNHSLFFFFFFLSVCLCVSVPAGVRSEKNMYLLCRTAAYNQLVVNYWVILNEKTRNDLVPSFFNWNIFRILYSLLGCEQNKTFQDVIFNISHRFWTF